MQLNSRIKATYKSGSTVDSILGFSSIHGKRTDDKVKYISLSKADPSCYANNYVQELQLLVSEYLQLYCTRESPSISLVYDFYTQLDNLETKYLNSLSGFMFVLGESIDHLFPDTCLEEILSLVQALTVEVGDAPDFTVALRHPQFNLLARIEVQVRLLESRYTEWRYRSEILKNMYQMVVEGKTPEYVYNTIQGITYNAECLNALSKLLYWGRRYLMKLSGVQEQYWNH
jgi:hypothetical protein